MRKLKYHTSASKVNVKNLIPNRIYRNFILFSSSSEGHFFLLKLKNICHECRKRQMSLNVAIETDFLINYTVDVLISYPGRV